MARYCKFLLFFSFILFVSCQEGGEAGDLFGQWRMNGSDTQFVSFSGSVVKFNSLPEGEVYGSFQHHADSLFMQCVSIKSSPSDTAIVEKTFVFKPFTNIRLKIEALDGDQLIVSKDNKTWSFKKY